MATIVNAPGSGSDGGSGGWIVAGVVIIGVILVAIFVWPGYGRMTAEQQGSTNIEVNLPSNPNSRGQ